MYRYITVTCIFLCTHTLYAQADLSGRWLVDFDKTIELMSNEKRKEYDSIRIEQRNRLVENFSTRTFLFDKSGVVSISWIGRGVNQTVTGTWLLNGDELSIFYSQGYRSIYVVELLDDGSLILAMKSSAGMFEKLFSSKNK